LAVDEGRLEFHTIRVVDRFGDYGLVGLIGFRAIAFRLEVDTFLLSCRVLGKGVEHRVVAHLGAVAAQRGLQGLDVRFVPTKRNTPALQFAQSLAAAVAESAGEGAGMMFRLTTAAALAVRFDPTHAPAPAAAEGSTSASTAEPPTGPGFLARIPVELSTSASVWSQISRDRHAERSVTPPRTPIEAQLVRLWSECLGRTPGIEENYFDLRFGLCKSRREPKRRDCTSLQNKCSIIRRLPRCPLRLAAAAHRHRRRRPHLRLRLRVRASIRPRAPNSASPTLRCTVPIP
jgi:hypothetical protein